MPTDKAGLIARFADRILAGLVALKDTPNTFTKAQAFSGTIVETPLSVDPATPVEGQRWARSGSGLRLFLGGALRTILDTSMFATTAQAQAGTATDVVMNPASAKETVLAFAPTEGQATDLAYFGDGADGNLVASSGTTTLTRDTYYNNVTLSGSAVINTAGYRLFIRGVLDISGLTSGYIGRPSPDASGLTQGAALPAGTLGGSVAGVGSGSPGLAAASAAGGGGSGRGGAGGSGAAGAASASLVPATTAALQRIRRSVIDGLTVLTLLSGGASGGTGGSFGGDNGSGNYGAGGGGGGGGGVVFVFARTINRSASTVAGAIRARGGAGGTGGASTQQNAGGGGGGGGGPGGWVQVVCRFLTGAAAASGIDASGGAGGDGGAVPGGGVGTVGLGGGHGFGGFACLFNLSAGTATCLLGPQASTQPTGQAGEAAAATFVGL